MKLEGGEWVNVVTKELASGDWEAAVSRHQNDAAKTLIASGTGVAATRAQAITAARQKAGLR